MESIYTNDLTAFDSYQVAEALVSKVGASYLKYVRILQPSLSYSHVAILGFVVNSKQREAQWLWREVCWLEHGNDKRSKDSRTVPLRTGVGSSS